MCSCDLTGQVFGRLTVVCKSEKRKRRTFLWKCFCECGNIVYVLAGNLKSGSTRSCGCLRQETFTKHGQAGTHLYSIWSSMIQRCENPKNKAYSRYGGKGITVCSAWHDAKTFIDWAVEHGYTDTPKENRGKHCSIDRIDSNGNYCPENCRIISVSENSRRADISRWKGKTCDYIRLRNGRFA